jgi:hypothetical protein
MLFVDFFGAALPCGTKQTVSPNYMCGAIVLYSARIVVTSDFECRHLVAPSPNWFNMKPELSSSTQRSAETAR